MLLNEDPIKLQVFLDLQNNNVGMFVVHLAPLVFKMLF